MYVRTKVFKKKDGTERIYLQIVEGRREKGKVRQKVIASLGRLDELQNGTLDRLIESLKKYTSD